MRPGYSNPPIELAMAEETIVKRIRPPNCSCFCVSTGIKLFDEAYQGELAAAYDDSARGQPPVPPAQLALALILQAYTGVSDDKVIEALVMDRRWQLLLDCLDCEQAPFSKGTLVNYRQR